MLWLIFVGIFLSGFVLGRWGLVLLIPVALWFQRIRLEDEIRDWLTVIAVAALIGGVVLRWFATRQRA